MLLGPAVSGVLDPPPLTERPAEYHDASRVLLAISVMAVALRFPVHTARRDAGPVLLLVLVAMPAMAALGAGLATVVLGVAPAVAMLVGTAMCPTDPVLASSVVTGTPAEQDIDARGRRLLSLESGANDGLALPTG